MAMIPPPPPVPPAWYQVDQRQAAIMGSKYAAAHGGLLPESPWWAIAEAREDYAIKTGTHERFALNHPYIVSLLDRDWILRHPPAPIPIPAPIPVPVSPVINPVVPPVAEVPPYIPPPMVPPAGGQSPSCMVPVPEPSSLLGMGIGSVLIGAFLLKNRLLSSLGF